MEAGTKKRPERRKARRVSEMESIVKAALFEHAVGMNAIFEPEAYAKPEQLESMRAAAEGIEEIDFQVI